MAHTKAKETQARMQKNILINLPLFSIIEILFQLKKEKRLEGWGDDGMGIYECVLAQIHFFPILLPFIALMPGFVRYYWFFSLLSAEALLNGSYYAHIHIFCLWHLGHARLFHFFFCAIRSAL